MNLFKRETLRAALQGVDDGLTAASAPTIPETTNTGDYAFVAGATAYWFVGGKMGSFDTGTGSFAPTDFVAPDQAMEVTYRSCWDRVADRGSPAQFPGITLST